MSSLDFEKPILEIEGKIAELTKAAQDSGQMDVSDEVSRLEAKCQRLMQQTYSKLSPWQKTQVARHPDRPHAIDYINAIFEDFQPLAGDRNYGDDRAIIGGFATLVTRPGEAASTDPTLEKSEPSRRRVMVIGQEKGHDMATRMEHNFGMPRPEGYRKAIRLMDLAERFNLPVVSLVDTPGAYPGKGAEQRGQAEAIARSIDKGLSLNVPSVALVIGEGGSGGAIAIASASRVLMLEHSVYSVISPEGCASILWKDSAFAKDAADALGLTAQQLNQLGIVDRVIGEPLGGAHRDHDSVFRSVANALDTALEFVALQSPGSLKAARRDKYLSIGRLAG